MKLRTAIIIGLFLPVFCFAQTQTGDASYNASKSGLTITHNSLSFNTPVRVTNLRNNKEVIVTVNYRFNPPDTSRIADISKEAGDAIGMSPDGYTRVRLEVLPHAQTTPAPVQAAPAPTPAPPARSPPPASTPAPAPEPAGGETVENIQIVSQPPAQYIVTPPYQVQTCYDSPLCVAMFILLIITVILLVVILVLMLCMRRVPWWGFGAPWYYPVWVRRRLRYIKKRRN
jgi:hypothetical protein